MLPEDLHANQDSVILQPCSIISNSVSIGENMFMSYKCPRVGTEHEDLMMLTLSC